jgi:hypothetical protein
MFCVPTSPFIFKSIITFSFSFVFTGRLYAPYKLALYVILAVLNSILDYPGFKFTVAVYKGLFIKQPLFYILCVP